MISVKIDKTINKLVIITDDPSVKCLLEFNREITKYQPWNRSWAKIKQIDKIYDNTRGYGPKQGIYTFKLGLGWSAYIANVFKGIISQEDYQGILSGIYADTYPEYPFPGLRDYQNEDMLFILKYTRAIVQTNTSYGKTQCIATLANYAYEVLGKKVLIVTPGKKAKDEIIKRYKLLFGFDIPTSLDGDIGCIITSGFLNQKKIKDPNLRTLEEDKLKKFEWVLVDEVEYTINDSGKFIYDHCLGAERMYSFSGTASKKDGLMITFAQGITETVMDNKDLVSYFGPALVYRMPTNLTIDNIKIKTFTLNQITFDDIDDEKDGNIYLEILTKMWTFPPVCELIVKIAKKYKMLFIPINNLNNVIYEWINNYFVMQGGLRTLLICGEGYIYYDLLGGITKLSLQEACDYIRDGKVDIIPSTSSGYRALDFPGLENILLIQGIVAGVTLQAIGRVARGSRMNIISLEPKLSKRIPVYTKGFEHRDKMIQEYYKYCIINNITIDEDNL